MKKGTKRLPKLAYLTWDEQGDGVIYLMAAEKLEDHASKETETIVGTYKLVGEDVVQLVTEISQRKLRSR